jgi:S1-C subfamily serine protease
VTVGTMPDFAFPGPGVKVAAVTPGSPADKAGLKEGDVLLRLDGREIENLQAYSTMLRELSPGQAVKFVVGRGGAEIEVAVTVTER